MQGPSALTNAQLTIATQPTLGGEMKVYVTRDQALELALLRITAANTATNSDGSPFVYNNNSLLAQVNGYPMDMIVVAETPLTDSAPIAITVFGLDQNGMAQSGVAVIETPGYAGITDQQFEAGWAADVVPANPTNQWTSYTSCMISCTSAALYGQFSIWAMPNQTRYFLIGATQEKSFATRSQRPVAISGGLDEGAFIKPGAIPVGEMKVKARWVSFSDGLARFDGANICVRIDVVKEQKIIDQRIYAMGAVLNIMPSAGEVAAVGEFDATIMYRKLGIMCAMLTGQPAE